MEDGNAAEWEALLRLRTGEGSRADLVLLAENFRKHHLCPERISVPVALWLDTCLEGLIGGQSPEEVFKVKRPVGRPPLYTPAFKAFATLRYLQERRRLGNVDAAREAVLSEFNRTDWRNFERDVLLKGFGDTWTDEEVARRIENFRQQPRVFNRGDISP